MCFLQLFLSVWDSCSTEDADEEETSTEEGTPVEAVTGVESVTPVQEVVEVTEVIEEIPTEDKTEEDNVADSKGVIRVTPRQVNDEETADEQ